MRPNRLWAFPLEPKASWMGHDLELRVDLLQRMYVLSKLGQLGFARESADTAFLKQNDQTSNHGTSNQL